jgi:hypothetical protein
MADNPTQTDPSEECPRGNYQHNNAHAYRESRRADVLYCSQCGNRIPLRPERQEDLPEPSAQAVAPTYCPHPECYAGAGHEGKHTTLSGREFTDEERPAEDSTPPF